VSVSDSGAGVRVTQVIVSRGVSPWTLQISKSSHTNLNNILWYVEIGRGFV